MKTSSIFYLPSFCTLAYVTIFIGFLSYVYLKKCRRYWADKGVPCLKPSSWLFGSIGDVLTLKIPEIEHVKRIYRQTDSHKVAGYYGFHRPRLVVRDPELLKFVMTKDFAHFVDRNDDIFADGDILMKNLFNLTGEKWKLLRAKLTPSFTSGKMKSMFLTMRERAESMTFTLNRTLSLLASSSCDVRDIDVKDLTSRYTLEVIAACAFGLEVNSLENPDSLIRKMTLETINGNWRERIASAFFVLFPKIFKILGVKIFSRKHEEFYKKLIMDTIDYRRKNGIQKNDFIGSLITMMMADNDDKKNVHNVDESDMAKELEITPDLVTGECFLFLLAGFETSSSTMSYCLLELSRDTKIQQKLRCHVNEILKETDGKFTYDALQKMTYLDQIVFETLRMYPLLSNLQRVCTKLYRIPDTKITIEPGTFIDIPVAGIHYDSRYYPNPEEFNPDNFSDENKNSRSSYTFLGFGEGPRGCIGMRFGLMQAKLGLAMLVKHYEFKLSPRMKLPLEFACNSIGTLTSVKGIRLTCNKLQNEFDNK